MIKVEVATTFAKLSRGLMYRDHLPQDSGMLFVFDRVQPLSFWGRNTFIPLDIAFIDREGKVVEIGRIRKLSEIPVRSSKPCLMALEVNEGVLKAHGVSSGDLLVMDKKDGSWVVTFDQSARTQKTAQSRKTPKLHPILPFNQGNDPIKMPDWMKDQPQDQPLTQPTAPEQNSADQSSELPEIPLDQFMTADDEPEWGQEWADDWDELDPAQQNQQPQPEDQPEQPADEELPDAKQMSNDEALDFAEQNGVCMQITYMIKPKTRKVGGMTPARTIRRNIQPQGKFHARTTGNSIAVTWDLTVNDFRAFIIPQIVDKQFTGERFEKWFRVKQDEQPMSDDVQPLSYKIQ
jgi:uncharacterized membrane protein (UPF0127 family)